MTRISTILAATALAGTFQACRTSAAADGSATPPDAPVAADIVTRRPIGGAPAVMPHAIIYRTNGDYADNVPVTLGTDGGLQSFPAPGDLGPDSRPLPLADGYWLDRRGVSRQSVFTTYTYAGYASLKQAPPVQQLLQAVIPGSAVTRIVELPMTLQKAVADTVAVNRMITDGSPDLRVLYE